MNIAGPVEVNNNPYPGLRPFHEDEEYLFFGRERRVDSMVDKLSETRFLAVVGTSGSGKSSLVNCGLRPALHSGLMTSAGTSWRIAQFRPGGDPLRAMSAALAQDGVLFSDRQTEGLTLTEVVETSLRMSKLGLIDIFQQARLSEDDNLLVVVDQFEELFRYQQLRAEGGRPEDSGDEDATAFVNLLLEAAKKPDCPIYVVLTMRSDFLGDCSQFPGLAEAINRGQYLVPRMTRDELRDAISGPAAVRGAEISPVLLTRLVNDVGDNPDQLSILQHALNRTWAKWENDAGGKGALMLEHYEAIGSMSRALDQHAERAFGELISERQQRICETIFKALTDTATDPRGVRRPTKLATLCDLADATEDEVRQVIEVFRKPSRSFLMPPAGEPLVAETVVDISHESLMRVWQRLNGWAREEAESVRMYRRLADTAALYEDGKASLWRDPDLQLALRWRKEESPTAVWARRYGPHFDETMRFLEMSVTARDEEERLRQEDLRSKRNRRRWMFGSLAVIIVMSAILTLLWNINRNLTLDRDLETVKTQAAAALWEAQNGDPLRGMFMVLRHLGQNAEEQDPRSIPVLESSLWQAFAQAHLQRIIDDHEAEVRAVAFNHDGSLMASGGYDGNVYVYDTSDWSLMADFEEDGSDDVIRPSRVLGLAFAPDGKSIATSSWSYPADHNRRSGRGRLWDSQSGNRVRDLIAHNEPDAAHEGPVRKIVFDGSGQWLATVSYDNTARIWNARSGELKATLSGHRIGDYGRDVYDVAFHPTDSDIIATIGSDGRAIVWDLSILIADSWAEYVAPGAFDGPNELDEIAAKTVIDAHAAKVQSVTFSPDGTFIMTASDDDSVRVWDWKTGEQFGRSLMPHNADVWRAIFDRDGRRFFTASWDRTIAVWDFETFSLLDRFGGHTRPVRDIAFSHDTGYLASASSDNTVRIWALEAEDVQKRIHTNESLYAVRVNPADHNLAATGGNSGAVKIWDLRTGVAIQTLQDTTDECPIHNWQPLCRVRDIVYSSNGTRIASQHHGGAIRIWDTEGRVLMRSPDIGRTTRMTVLDNDILAVSTSAKDIPSLVFWNMKDGTELGAKDIGLGDADLSARTVALAYSPMRKLLAAGSRDGTIQVWNLDTGEALESFKISDAGWINKIRFSPSGETLFAAAEDWAITAWDLDQERQPRVMRGHQGSILDLAVIDDGRRIASVSDDETVKIWDTLTGNEIVSLPGHTSSVRSVDAVSHADLMVTASDNGTLLVRKVFDDAWALRQAVCNLLTEKILPDVEEGGQETETDVVLLSSSELRTLCPTGDR